MTSNLQSIWKDKMSLIKKGLDSKISTNSMNKGRISKKKSVSIMKRMKRSGKNLFLIDCLTNPIAQEIKWSTYDRFGKTEKCSSKLNNVTNSFLKNDIQIKVRKNSANKISCIICNKKRNKKIRCSKKTLAVFQAPKFHQCMKPEKGIFKFH